MAGLTRIVGRYRTVKVAFQQYIQYEGGGFAVVGCGLSLDVELLLLVVLVLFVDVVGSTLIY